MLFRNGIVAAFMPGMATTQARHGQPRSAQCAVLRHRLHRILGTRRIKPAIAPEPRAEQVPVHANQGDEEFCHREIRDHIAARSPNRSLFILFATPGLANTTTSTAASWAWCCRKLSRTTRLTRFLSTARAAALRDTTVPKRAWSRPFARARTVNAPRLNRRDPSKTALNWTDSHKRWRRASANDTAETALNGQTRAALGTTTLQYLTAFCCCHTCTETVGTLALQNGRLISTLHIYTPLAELNRPSARCPPATGKLNRVRYAGSSGGVNGDVPGGKGDRKSYGSAPSANCRHPLQPRSPDRLTVRAFPHAPETINHLRRIHGHWPRTCVATGGRLLTLSWLLTPLWLCCHRMSHVQTIRAGLNNAHHLYILS